MFLSSLIKTQSKSNALNTALSTSSKINLNPFLKIQVKHVSRSLTSRENREKYDLKKMDDYWEAVDQEYNRRKEIAKQIEEKYKTKSEHLISASKQTASEVKEIYFVPLTKRDEAILQGVFKPEVLEDIRKGGRLVLLDEVRKYNKAHPFTRIEMDFEPLDAQDFEKIKKSFNFLLCEKEFFVVALQQGKKIFEFLEAFKQHKADLVRNLNAAFRRVEHLEAIESNHPLRSNLCVSLRKMENAQWIKSLFAKNKIDEKFLSEKFNKMYFEYLDFLNSAAAASRGFDVELFQNEEQHKIALEAAKIETIDKLTKIKEFLQSRSSSEAEDFTEEGTAVDENSDAVQEGEEAEEAEAVEGEGEGEAVEGEAEAEAEEGEAVEEELSEEEFEVGIVDKSETQNDQLGKSENENQIEGQIESVKDQADNAEVSSDEDTELNYNFDPEKDYSHVYDKDPQDVTYDEYEYIRYCTDKAADVEYAYLNTSYEGRLLMKLYKAELELTKALEFLEKNGASVVFATKNLIKSTEIDEIINELNSLHSTSTNPEQEIKFDLKKKLDITNEDNLVKLTDDPVAFLQNLYWDLVKSAAADKALKIPESVQDKETYVFRVLLKYFADVVQSKDQAFNEEELRLDYFGEKLKSYELYARSQKDSNNNLKEEATSEEDSNPENLFTPNFKKLIEFLNKEHGLVEKSVYNYKFNVESQGYKYPWNVMDLKASLPGIDGLGKEVLKFYLENSNERNLLSDNDEEKVFSVLALYLEEIKDELHEAEEQKAEETPSFSQYKPSSYYSNLLEKNFYDRIQAYMHKAAKSNLFFKALKSSDLKKLDSAKTNNHSELETSGEIIESLLIKGVFADRALNNRPDAYLLVDNQEALGVKYYMHKSLKGINDYNLEDPYLTSFNDDTIEGDMNEEKIKLVKTRDNKLVLRVYYQINDASRLMLLNDSNKDLLNNIGDKSSVNKMQKHFLVFENELKSKSNLALLTNSFESWLASHEIDMRNWKLVDADNFMRGNSFFNNKTALEAQLNAGVNSLEELGAALNGYFYEENSIKEQDPAESPAQGKADKEAEKDKGAKAKKDAAASAAEVPKDKSKKEANESKKKEKDGGKGKKGDKAEKSEKNEKSEKSNKEEEKAAPQKLTQLHSSYKLNYLFDLKDSQEYKKYIEDTVKITELIEKEITKIQGAQTAQKKALNDTSNKTQEKSEEFFNMLMEYIDIENHEAELDNEELVELMESEVASEDLKKGYKEVSKKKNESLKGLIDSYRQLNDLV